MSRLSVVADANIRGLEDALGDVAEITLREGRAISRQDLLAADALLVRSITQVNESLLANTAIKFVGTATSGFDHVDRDYLQAANIHFVHTPGSNANSVVEYVLTAIASVGQHLEILLSGGRIGIIGYGHIGRLLAQRLTGLGIDHVVYDPWLTHDSISNNSDLETVLASAVISLHCALTEEKPWPSKHLLNAANLSQIPAESLLINASRGPVIDNAALCTLLAHPDSPSGVLDVWEHEPVPDIALLDQVDIGTAHIAGYSDNSKSNATAMLVDAVHKYFSLTSSAGAELATEPLLTSPGKESSDSEFIRGLLTQRYDIYRDDQALRSMVRDAGGDREQIAIGFDALRKAYPVRRELAGHQLQGKFSSAQLAYLKALGCIPVVHDTT